MKLSVETYLSHTGDRVIRIVDETGRSVGNLNPVDAGALINQLSDAINIDDVHTDVEESFSFTFIGCPENYAAEH